MHANHWLIGLALCVAGIGNAAASSHTTQDLDSTTHAATDSSSPREESGSGDVVGLTHNCPPRAARQESTSGSSAGSSDRSGSSGSSPAPVRQSHLGWQSLLPGSIQ
ncbi:MAG: hypothetical protein ABI870_13025 [Rhodanobacter sp.]